MSKSKVLPKCGKVRDMRSYGQRLIPKAVCQKCVSLVLGLTGVVRLTPTTLLPAKFDHLTKNYSIKKTNVL